MMNGNDIHTGEVLQEEMDFLSTPKEPPIQKVKQPYLMTHWLGGEYVNYIFPVCWEVSELKQEKGEKEEGLEIIAAGEIDFSSLDGRRNLAELASWCYDIGYALTTYKKAKHDVQGLPSFQHNRRNLDSSSISNRKGD